MQIPTKANMDRITVALLRARRQGAGMATETVRPKFDAPAESAPALALVRVAENAQESALSAKILDDLRLHIDPRESANTDQGSYEPSANVRLPAALPAATKLRVRYSRSRVVKVSSQHFANRRIAVDRTHPELLDAVRVLRTQVLQRMRENGWQTLAVVSPSDDDGKSMVAANLAAAISMDMNHTALLVDANLRRPSIHRYFGVSHKPGLAHYLVKNAPVESLLVNPGINRLLVVPAGAVQPNSAELLGSDQMRSLVEELKHRYAERITIFDLPPLLTSADAMAFLPNVDAVLMVVGEGVTDREELQRAEAMLSATNLIGVTLNFARERIINDRRRQGFFRRLFNLS